MVFLGTSLAALGGCGGGSSNGSTSTSASGGDGGSGGGSTASTSSGDGGSGGGSAGDECTAKVEIALYKNDQCTDPPVVIYTLDTAQSCAGWTRETDTGEMRSNSATRFQCYQDRLCYTQYVESFTCDSGEAAMTEDKEARTNCAADPTPGIWAKILSGTEKCPAAPAGFECPMGAGTAGLKAACE